MPRIRTVKPDFFEDEDIGLLSMSARLLFIASWTLADDEGLLRWVPAYLKAHVFMYDDDIDQEQVEALMAELEEAQLIFPYRAGKSRQRLGWIVNFRRHQRINRPQPGKLPPPCIQNGKVVEAYCRRDRWTCAICGEPVIEDPIERATDGFRVLKKQPSLDHIQPRSKGGLDYPSNLRLAHQGCNASRGNRSENDSLNDSVNGSLTERKGKEGEGEREEEKETPSFSTEFQEWLEHYRAVTGNTAIRGSRPARESFGARRKEFSLDDLKLATVGCHGDDFCRTNGHDVPETILRASKVQRYIKLGRESRKPDALARLAERPAA